MAEDQIPASLLHPKNLALLAKEKLALPEDHPCEVMVLSSIPWAPIYVEVSRPDGPVCEVTIDEGQDTVDSLARKIDYAIDMVLDAERRQSSRQFRWADQHPEALKELVDPSIRIVDGRLGYRWALPAGWVGIVNRLHADLIEILGDYQLIKTGTRLAGLRYIIDRQQPDDEHPELRQTVEARLSQARKESLTVCDLCGEPAEGRATPVGTRCPRHKSARQNPPQGTFARPPGWIPARGQL